MISTTRLTIDQDGSLDDLMLRVSRERDAGPIASHISGELPDTGGAIQGNVHHLSHARVNRTHYRPENTGGIARQLKVAIDCAAAVCALVVLAPLLIAIAIAVKCDGGPVLYAHTRVGRGGRKFDCLKFRSMVQDSGAVLQTLLQNDPNAAAEWHATHKLRRDPRITRVGRLLRGSSLDELPQLFNVLRLEMSLVGPRPIVTEEVSRYGDSIALYFAGRPGLTGLWQISGRSDTSYAQRVALDSEYVSTWSMWQDFSIIARTVPAVLRRRGAC